MEAVAFQVLKAGSGGAGAEPRRGARARSRARTPPGPSREVPVTATIEAIDKKAQTVTIKGPGQRRDDQGEEPEEPRGLKVGDMVDITYAQALAVALDKPVPK